MAGSDVATKVTGDMELRSCPDKIRQGGVLQPTAHPQSVCPEGGQLLAHEFSGCWAEHAGASLSFSGQEPAECKFLLQGLCR